MISHSECPLYLFKEDCLDLDTLGCRSLYEQHALPNVVTLDAGDVSRRDPQAARRREVVYTEWHNVRD